MRLTCSYRRAAFLAATAAFVFVLACQLATNSDGDDGGGDDTTTISAVADLRLSTEVSNWSEASGSYKEFDVQGLYDIINGGAVTDENNGLVEGIFQEMAGSSGRNVEIRVEDFGNAASATAMFNYSATNSVSQKVTFADFAEATAVGTQVLGGVTVFAHFGKFYFNLQFTGYSDNQVAAADANGFLKTYQNKLQ